ncbi:MAG TPA: FAD-dependent oxidoreductase [Clostridiaceae bacterium]
MDYDVLILGGGIVGCAAAYELSKYNLNIALIEKEYDVAGDVSLLNTIMVYDGLENDDEVLAKLEYEGSVLIAEAIKKFKIPYKKIESIIFAKNAQDNKKVEKIYKRAQERRIEGVTLLNEKDIKKLEPLININIKNAIYTKNTAIICPYDLAIAYGEVAFENGVKFKLEEEVLNLENISAGFSVITNKNKFTCKYVIDTTPIKSEEDISNIRMHYCILDKEIGKGLNKIVGTFSSNGERIFILPMLQGSNVIVISSKEKLDYVMVLERAREVIPEIKNEDVLSYFSEGSFNEEIVINDSALTDGYIRISGKHYGKVNMTPAIVKKLSENLVHIIKCKEKKDFNDKRREFYKFKELSLEEKKNIIKINSKYGNIICVCKQITEGEILDSIRRPLGARTIEGIRKRTGVTEGLCNGSYCLNKIVSILARETNKSMLDIVKDTKGSKILGSRIKEFDSV